MRERENGFGLSLRVGVENVGLDIASVFEQPIEDVDSFPDTAWNEVAEQSNVGIRDMVVADATITSVTDVVFGGKILFVQVPSLAVRRSMLA
jgi:hypothetical protein